MTRVWRTAPFALFLALLVGSVMIISSQQLAYVLSQPEAWLLSIVLLAATAIPAGLIIYRFDQFEPEPAALIVVALTWGALIAVSFAAVTNSYLLSFLQNHLAPSTFDAWGAALVAPIDEELYKGAGLVAIYLMARQEIDGLVDGLVYGAMIGLGFQVMENVQYFLHAAEQTGGSPAGAVVSTYFVRVVLAGLYSHTLFTGLMGFGFAYAVTSRRRSRARRYGVFALCAVLAWAAHFVWNSPWLDSFMGGTVAAFIAAIAIKGLPFVLFLVILGWFARRKERQAFDKLIAAEVGSDVVSEAEVRILERGRRRRAALRAIKRNKGAAARSLLKQLQREQMNLALFHAKTGETNELALELQREKIRALRARLTAIA
jgi:RsiW-degrading membrane proteinase PrsW (M82 family)